MCWHMSSLPQPPRVYAAKKIWRFECLAGHQLRWACESVMMPAAMVKKLRIAPERITTPGNLQMVVADMPFWVAHWWKFLLW